ncbi:MAG TPA: saccharopine dehydrogenase NADP-binding domain-containing protein [Solirubrobacteraceae bacterium]|nr:saccharopine dehydrogenase NADP-binding domain-containing protein [Solirubrobacteraceae bacterium]
MADRRFDIVLLGATGFTGALTAEYLARNAPAQARWALAGRNAGKLEQVRARLAAINPSCADLELLSADTGDPASMRDMAEATRVVITTVGPYIRYGEPVVAACAAAGTDYVDLTGEPEFVDRMWFAYHEEAERTGARIVHSCGFDSIPYDLGVQFTVEQLPEDVPISIDGFMRSKGSFSGGTYQSAIEILGDLRSSAKLARERRRQEGPLNGRRVRGVRGTPHPDEFAGGWVVPFPTIDPITVLRSARALDRYGPDFSYSHYAVAGPLPMLVGLGAAAGLVAGLAQIPPARDLLMKLKSSGEGPSEEQRAKSWFRVRFSARVGGNGKRLRTEVSGGDPGYGDTSKMLAESALCLAHDDLPDLSGQLTPAVAMGDALRLRLGAAGIKFEVLDG